MLDSNAFDHADVAALAKRNLEAGFDTAAAEKSGE